MSRGTVTDVGIVGLGVISRQYLDTLLPASSVRIAAVADLDPARAAAAAEGIPGCRALTTAELLEDRSIRTVLNLTIPAAHAEVALAAIAHGKDVYGEKPLAATFADALRITDAATAAGVHVGGAPDTVLGTGVQTARAAIDDGRIGRPVSASAMWISAGHESWHPQPDFYYREGGGPLLDMGPYYVTSLVQLLGPVSAVSGASSRSRDERVIGSGPRAGEGVPVEVDTHLTGILHHASGAISTVTMSFDGVRSTAAPIEVHGVDGSLLVPDPNHFDGDVQLHTRDASWETLEPSAGYVDSGRGIGLLDLVAGGSRASGAMALHVLEIMTALAASAASGVRESLTTTVERPSLVPLTPAEHWRRL
ncbi:Gfo/Idh/MocA family oxidoreductase [Microbacterium trichothecenolyticum]|uniref:Gfo/Idh/MocA family oxidoreductase n=1 Tax=Microbacterium ureisolvens TaxID=2781186 RepID=A0ABS7I0F0_9MICO|nr:MULTISPECIES: Gfo/Idh/MocA family oxidoreductase [Microbacterium]MBW9111129.1 Gfo/Idh/MocA family oxidoreductase [Microbacterium ureisolvens]MBW9122037.1 Gfo/Idh/MocA family oxidoreductase [Microbacterium trichothecenolyticum]